MSVYRNGDLVVTIESNSLVGRDLQPGDDDAIRTAARNLLGFIGESTLSDDARLTDSESRKADGSA